MTAEEQNFISRKRAPGAAAKKAGAADSEMNAVRVLARGLVILRVFTPKNNWLSNHEIGALADLPRPTVSRLTANLAEEGYLEYSRERGQYRLGVSVLALGYAALANIDICEAARPYLQELADIEDALVVLSTRDGMAMVCNEVYYGRNMLTLRVGVGSRLALSTSAVGRALIGALPDEQRLPLLDEIRAHTKDDWVPLAAEFDNAVTQIRDKKYYSSIGTLEQGVNGVGAVLDIAGAPFTYVIGIAAPSFRFEPQLLEERVGPNLLKAKQKIEEHMATVNRPS